MELIEQDPAVFEQFAAGEIEAFEVLFRQFQGEVFSWIVRIVRDPSAAEDLTIETFWKIYRAHARYDPNRRFEAWARRIATNVAVDYLKKPQVRSSQPIDDLQAASDLGSQNPAVRREMRERTQLAFDQLPAKLRVVAILALVEDSPHAEIAEALNISTAAVKSRLFRATRLLRRKLGNLDTTHE
jgi:RNA polymerase sigma-70 factor (ECF subfamily)